MDKEIFVKKMQVSGILFKYDVPINEGKIIGTFIEELEQQCKKQKEVINKLNDLLSDEFLEVIDRDTLLDILNEVTNNE